MADTEKTTPTSDDQLPLEQLQEIAGGVNTFEEATQNITHLDQPRSVSKSGETIRAVVLEEVDDQTKGE
jgi:hypothetical protein